MQPTYACLMEGMGKHSTGPKTKVRQFNKQNKLWVQRKNPGFKKLKKFNRRAAIAAEFPLQILLPAELPTCCVTLNSPSLPQDSPSAFARLGEPCMTLASHMCHAQHSRARGPWHFHSTNVIASTIHRPVLLQQSSSGWLSLHWAAQVLLLETKVIAVPYQEGLLTCWGQVLNSSLHQTWNNIAPHSVFHNVTEITGTALTEIGLKTHQSPVLYVALF